MRRLKIWFLADRYSGTHGGTEKQVLMLIRALSAQRHDVRLYVLKHTAYSRATTAFPCPIRELDVTSMLSWHALQRMWGFRKEIKRERPDVVHAFFNDAAIMGPLFGRTQHTAVVTSRRDMGFWYDFPTLVMLRIAEHRTNLIICNAQAVAREVERREMLPKSRLRVIYNGIDDLPVAHDGEVGHGLPDRTNVDRAPNGIRVCLLANVRRIKRIGDFVEAAARLRHTHPQCEFLVIGHPNEPAYQSELQALTVRLNVADRLQFVGMLSEPLDVLRGCHIGVLTSQSEGLSNTILEYMRAGLPVVCSNTGGNPELVTHGRNGLLYDTGNIAQLTACLDQLCRDARRRSEMGAAGLRDVERFSVKAMTDAHVELYSELCPET